MTDYTLDEIDREIIKHLAKDGRVSNREIARQLDLTEGTIRARIKRLEAEDIVRVSAVVQLERLENSVLAFLWIETAPHFSVSEVAKFLTDLPDVNLVMSLIGRADILAMTNVKTPEDAVDYIHGTIYQVPGVHRVRHTFSRHVMKHDYQFTSLI